MTLRTRILLTSGINRFGAMAVLLAIPHPLSFIPAAAWLLFCQPLIRYALVPFFVRSTICTNRKCRYLIPLKQQWKIGEFKNNKAAHVYCVNDDEGKVVRCFDCPHCKTTIPVQKGTAHKYARATVIGHAFHLSPTEQRNIFIRLWHLWRLFKSKKVKMPLGYDRMHVRGWMRRCWDWMLKKDSRKKVLVPEDVYGCHMQVFGKSGRGKSKLMLSIAKWVFENGMGATFIDKGGDLADQIIRIVPKDRIKDVIWIRVREKQFPYQVNLLEAFDEDEELDLNEDLLETIEEMSSSHRGDIIAEILQMAIESVRSFCGSIKDVYDMIASPAARSQLVCKLADPDLIEWWAGFDRVSLSAKTSAKRKLRALVKHKRLGPIVNVRKSNFDANAIIQERKIVVVDLSTGAKSKKGNIGLGKILISKIRAAAFRQQFKKEHERVRHFLFVDEAKNFMGKGTDFEDIFSEARKVKLSLILANQNIGQMSQEVKKESFGNAGVIASFSVDKEDATFIADRMPNVTADQIEMQDVRECVVKIHNQCRFVKTEFVTMPEYDPTEEIRQRMHALHKVEPVEVGRKKTQQLEFPDLAEVEVRFCEGVK